MVDRPSRICLLVPLPSAQVKNEFLGKLWRQEDSIRQRLRRSLVEFELLTHDDLEPALSIAHDAEHLLVGAPSKEGLVDDDWPARNLGLTPNPVYPPCSLFERARVP